MSIDWTKMVTSAQKQEDELAGKHASISAKRYAVETSGVVLGGIPIDTGRDSQGLIAGAALSALLDPEYVCRWKTPAGPLTLDAEQLKAVAQGVRAHVQACFDREFELRDHLDAGTFTDNMLDEGWPV
jgi:hypothetical protein